MSGRISIDVQPIDVDPCPFCPPSEPEPATHMVTVSARVTEHYSVDEVELLRACELHARTIAADLQDSVLF